MTDRDTTPETVYAPARFSLWVVMIYLFSAMTGAHALSVYLVFALRAWVGETNNLIMFFNEMVHLGVLPSLGLLPVCLLLRRWGLVLLLVPIVGVCAAWYGPHLLPKDITPPAADAPVISVLTYNIAGLNSLNRDWGHDVDMIRAADADVVAIQELSPSAAEVLTRELDYPYTALYPANGATGSGIFSRYPITEDSTWQITFINQRVELDVNGTAVTVFNVHPPPPLDTDGFNFERRNTEIDEIIRRIDDEPTEVPLIAMGDFNTGDRTERYATIQQRLDDAWAEAGRGIGFTFMPRRLLPLFRIDFIFYNAQLRPITAEVRAAGGSDHRAVRAEFTLPAADGSSP